MRVKNSLLNMFYGIIGQVISIVLGFVVRTVFIFVLGVEYLGIDGLFTSILMMLALANLGFDTAMIFSLYKPLANKNIYKIQAYMNLYKKAYRIIGLIVLVIGLGLWPFIPYFINGDVKVEHINSIYFLFLLNSVSSYYLIYKHALLIADQKNYVISKSHIIFTIISNILQVLTLLIVKNYLIVLCIQLFFRILENYIISKKVDQLYPFIKLKNSAVLSTNERKEFFSNLYSLFLYKLSAFVINGTDNILLSIFFGITIVGIYSNYLLIISTIISIASYLFYSVTASIGNLINSEGTEKKYFIFRVLNFTNFCVYGFCAVCLWFLLNPFIVIWLGEHLVLNQFVVLFIVLNFFTAGMQNAPTTYRETTGLFKKGKYRPVIAAMINIFSSILFIKTFGVAGVFMGTIFSRLCTYFWYDPFVIFKYTFKRPVKEYFIKMIYYYALLIVILVVLEIFFSFVTFDNTLLTFLIKLFLCTIIPNIVIYMAFRRSEELKYLLNIMKPLINKSFNGLYVREVKQS
ncbi:MAG: sugar translocase [Bacillaceae bacterium]|nr:sugar translocase [Bacillaceae bacterium]